MSDAQHKALKARLSRSWWIAKYAVRFFAPRIGRTLVDLATVPVFMFVAVGWFGLYRDWQGAWATSDWSPVLQGGALLAVLWVTSCTLTVLAVLFDWVHTTRRAILTICVSFFFFYLLMMLTLDVISSLHNGFVTGMMGLLLGLGFTEVTSRVRPWKRDSWNGRSLRERWTSRRNRLGAS